MFKPTQLALKKHVHRGLSWERGREKTVAGGNSILSTAQEWAAEPQAGGSRGGSGVSAVLHLS